MRKLSRRISVIAGAAFLAATGEIAAGILVPIGTFNQSGDVTLWSGVPPTQYPTITVTRQQANGYPASSGQRVLFGHAHSTS